jgi:DNA gyrase subunit A
MKLVEERGSLVGALIASEDDEVYAIASDGVVIRTRVAEIRATGRDTMGVSFMDVSGDNAIVAVARGESGVDDDDDLDDDTIEGSDDATTVATGEVVEGDASTSSTPTGAVDPAGSVTVTQDEHDPDADGDPATED